MTPAFLDAMSWEMAEVYGAITDQIIINLAHYFPFYKSIDELPRSTFTYQAKMLAQMGKINKETIRIIRDNLSEADDALKRILEQAVIDSVSKAEPELLDAVKKGILQPPSTPIVAPNQMKAFQRYYKQAADKLNLVNTVMLESTQSAYQQAVSGVINEIDLAERMNRTQMALDIGAGETITGVSTWNQAVRHSIDKMKNGGITGYIDHAGRHWSAEAYVAMDIRTTTMNTGRTAVWETNEGFGNDCYLVSSHAGARPLCYPWQNKVISSLDASRDVTDLYGNTIHVYAQSETSYGQPAGLFGINCGHFPSPWIPGVSTMGREPQSAEANEKTYAESQEQRKLERKIREQKRDLDILKAQGANDEEIAKQREKIRATSQDIDDFCQSTGRQRHRDREAVYTKREFPDADKYDVEKFEHQQQQKIREYYQNGGEQQNYTFGQMTPNVSATPEISTVIPEQNTQDIDWFGFNNVDEISDKLSEQLNIPVDFTGMDKTLAARTARLYEALHDDYGVLPSSIRTDRSNSAWGKTSHSIRGEKAIVFSRNKFSSSEKLVDTLSKGISAGEFVKIKGTRVLDYVQTHEYAHLFGSYQYDLLDNYNQEFWGEIFDLYMEAKDKKTVSLGKYALKTPDEFLAEAFSDGYLNRNPSEYGSAVKRIVDKYFKK